MDTSDDRFRGFKQLIGDEAYSRIRRSSACVVGLGGVGSWVVEGLARSGVGSISLVDLDEVCVTNINRQLQATTSSVGRQKAVVLAERIREISPTCQVRVVSKFFSRATAEEILGGGSDVLIDAIDRVENKAVLLAECVRRGIPAITVGAAGDRLNPLGLTVSDLSTTVHDPLLQIVRKDLRTNFGFPRGERSKFLIPCIYAPKQQNAPRTGCVTASRKSCNDGLGSSVSVTGTAGFIASSVALDLLAAERRSPVYPWYLKRAAAIRVYGGKLVECESDSQN
jgi:tRNA A37 threonylcarbamoyladenosine dehydratase